jgi:hypothetical protein
LWEGRKYIGNYLYLIVNWLFFICLMEVSSKVSFCFFICKQYLDLFLQSKYFVGIEHNKFGQKAAQKFKTLENILYLRLVILQLNWLVFYHLCSLQVLIIILLIICSQQLITHNSIKFFLWLFKHANNLELNIDARQNYNALFLFLKIWSIE